MSGKPHAQWVSRHRPKLVLLCLAIGVVSAAVWWVDRFKAPLDPSKSGFIEATPAQYYKTGWDYYTGDGVAQDYAEAAKMFLKAAEQGYAAAQSVLGVCYDTGKGVPQDQVEAVKWFIKAAEQGDADARRNLGLCYENGQGVSQDQVMAVKWFRLAAEQGDAESQCHLGWCYDTGKGVPQDQVEAVKWCRLAAEQGNADAQHNLGVCYMKGQGVSQDQVLAVKWFRLAAEQGSAREQIGLGNLYYSGKRDQQDYSEAAKWFRRAAEQGDEVAQHDLGVCFENGQGVPQNDIEAYKWFSLAAAQGHTGSADARDSITQRMAREEVIEGQRRAAAFAPRTEGTAPGGEDPLPTPQIAEGTMVLGTGFFVTDDGYLVTCAHVVQGSASLHIKTPEGTISARLVAKDTSLDIALLKVSGTYHALPLAPNLQVRLGDSVFTIGFPDPASQGLKPKYTRGEISSLAGIRDDPLCFQISVPVQHGNSGGALVDERGNVVGVVAEKLSVKLDGADKLDSSELPENVNYAIKGGLVYDFLSRVPELSGKLKAPHTVADRDAAISSAERAAVLVIAE